MKCTAQIAVEGNPQKIYDCLKPESMDFERSSFTIKKGDNNLIIEIKAVDAVAFRATINAVTQLLAVYEKAGKIK